MRPVDVIAVVRSKEPDHVLADRYGVGLKTIQNIREAADNPNFQPRRGRPRGPSTRQHPGRKLTAEDVAAIRTDTWQTPQQLAAQFSVSVQTVYQIRRRMIWRHVP